MSRLPTHTRPEAYSIHIHVDPKRDEFSGQVEIRLRAPRGARSLELNAVDLEVSKVSVEDAGGDVPVRGMRANPKRETISLRLGRGLRAGEVSLRMEWTAPLRSDLRGLYQAR